MNHNEIKSEDYLFDLEHLEIIDLSHNEFVHLNETALAKMTNLSMLNVSHNLLKTIDFTFLASTDKIYHLDISNNLLNGQFNLNEKAIALTFLNIAGNNFTNFGNDLRKQAPKLTAIDLTDNDYECEYLKSLLLFLYFDNITSIIRIDDANGNEDNVKGIKCHKTSDKLNTKISTRINDDTIKSSLIKMIDDKFESLEVKIIDFLKNVPTTSVNVTNDN